MYFVFYAVFPSSTAVSPRDFSEATLIGGESHRSTLFILDMALWQILKMGKPSYDAGRDKVFVRETGSKDFPEEVKCGIVDGVIFLPVPFYNGVSRSLDNRTSLYINTLFLTSGLSPPSA